MNNNDFIAAEENLPGEKDSGLVTQYSHMLGFTSSMQEVMMCVVSS